MYVDPSTYKALTCFVNEFLVNLVFLQLYIYYHRDARYGFFSQSQQPDNYLLLTANTDETTDISRRCFLKRRS